MKTKKENPLITLSNFIRERDMLEKRERMKIYYKQYYQKHKENLKSYQKKNYRKKNSIEDVRIDVEFGKFIIEM